MGMKIDLCNYSGYKCYPSRGITYVKADGKTFRFLDGRSKKAHMLKRNPRKVTWTVLYRRKHRKGVEEETTKKKTKRTHKFQRAIVGASLNEILAKRNQKPELRKAQLTRPSVPPRRPRNLPSQQRRSPLPRTPSPRPRPLRPPQRMYRNQHHVSEESAKLRHCHPDKYV